MTGRVLSFPIERVRRLLSRRPAPQPAFSDEWCDRHLPLIEGAMDLLQVDDLEFGRRLRSIAEIEGAPFLAGLAQQIDYLAAHVAGIADSLAMTAMRIRVAMARKEGRPA